MDWYVVIKTIKGRRYYYRQKTWREGQRVRTRSVYIGPVDGSFRPNTGAGALPTPIADLKDLAKGGINAVMGKKARAWDHHWEAERSGPNQVERVQEIDEVLDRLRIQWTHDADGAYFNPGSEVVNIPPEECFLRKAGQSATSAYYIVTFHELTQWTMLHTKRKSDSFGSSYAREELVAELGAVMLMKYFGLEIGHEGRHALYFQTWLERIDPTFCSREDALKHAEREATRAVRFILERGKMQHA
jgi:hypothetical protein